MKKIILLLTAVLFVTLSTNAQDSSTNFGVKAGPNFSKYSGPLFDAEFKWIVGFYVGGFANFSISERFKIQPELLLSTQGSRLQVRDISIFDVESGDTVVGDFTTKTSETAIMLPIVSRFFVTEAFFLEAGPQLGFVFNTKEEVVESPTDDPNFNQISDQNYDKFDVGLAVGLGYKASEKIMINGRYFFGLIERNLLGVKSSVVNIGLEYQF